MCSAMSNTRKVKAYEIQEGKEKNPHDVDKVPIEPGNLDGRIVGGRKAVPPGLHEEDGEYADADDHVQRVQAGHGKVQGKEQFRRLRVRARVDKGGARH